MSKPNPLESLVNLTGITGGDEMSMLMAFNREAHRMTGEELEGFLVDRLHMSTNRRDTIEWNAYLLAYIVGYLNGADGYPQEPKDIPDTLYPYIMAVLRWEPTGVIQGAVGSNLS